MVSPKDSDELKRWARIMNKNHGYGGVFNRETLTDKTIVELSTCREWCESLAAEYGFSIGEPEHNPHDPPDCFVTFEGQRLDVELVQLIDPEHKRRAANHETPYEGQLFADTQWSKERLVLDLNALVKKKGDKYQQAGKPIEVLLIHTAEPWLNSLQAGEWLADVEIAEHPSISSTFLLFEYEPGRGMERCPVFWLYGDILGRRPSPKDE